MELVEETETTRMRTISSKSLSGPTLGSLRLSSELNRNVKSHLPSSNQVPILTVGIARLLEAPPLVLGPLGGQ